MLSKYTSANSQWLKSEDLNGWEGPTTIQFADEYEVKDQNGKSEWKAGFTFAQFSDKPYLSNVTNARRIEEMLVKQKKINADHAELKHCIGLQVWLYTEPTQTPSGSMTMGIRVKEVPANFKQMVESGHAGNVSAPGPNATASDRPPTPVQIEPAHLQDAPPPPSDQDDIPF